MGQRKNMVAVISRPRPTSDQVSVYRTPPADPEGETFSLQTPPNLPEEGGPDLLLRLTMSPDIFAYFGCHPSEPREVRAAAVSSRRRWAQGQRDNPKFRAESEALLRSYDACFRAVVDAPPAAVVPRSASVAAPDDDSFDDPATDTAGLWRLPPPMPTVDVAASMPGEGTRGLPVAARSAGVAAPLPALRPGNPTRSAEQAPLPAFGDSLVVRFADWWRWLFFRRGSAALPADATAISFGRVSASVAALPVEPSLSPHWDANGPPPWAGLDRLATPDVASLRLSLLEYLYGLRDAATAPAEIASLERLLRTCSLSELQFPLFPDSAIELQAAISDEDVSFAQLTSIVRRDPSLLQRVWEEASGAAYGRQRPPTVDAAVVRIGRRAIWRIGMRACVNAPVFRVRGWQAQANDLRSTGIVAAEVADSLDPSGAAFLPALLQGVGRLLVYRAAAPRPPRPTPDRAWVERVASSLQAPLGALIAENWQLGATVSAGIGFLPDPAQAGFAHRRTAEVVRAAVIATHEARANEAKRSYGGQSLLVDSGLTAAQARACVRLASAAWKRVPSSPYAGGGR